MSKLHILEANNKSYKVVVHLPVPTGSNPAGFLWKDVLLSAGISGTSILSVGGLPGNIAQAEMDNITSGDVLEFTIQIPLESGGGTVVSINQMVDKFITGKGKELKTKLKYYGNNF